MEYASVFLNDDEKNQVANYVSDESNDNNLDNFANDLGLSLRVIPFRNSNGDGGYFYLTDILTDDCEGMSLVNLVDNGKPNIFISEKEAEKTGVNPHPVKYVSLNGKNCYALFADKDRMGATAFGKCPYESYEDLKLEFQRKISKYLPENFDWDDHIGTFSYAAYA